MGGSVRPHKAGPACSRSAWLASTCPGAAAAISRAATFTASPIAVYWRRDRRPDLSCEDVAAVHPYPVLEPSPDVLQGDRQLQRETGGVRGGVLVGDGRAEGEVELGARAAMLLPTTKPWCFSQPGRGGRVLLQLSERVIHPVTRHQLVHPEHVDEHDGRAPVLGRQLGHRTGAGGPGSRVRRNEGHQLRQPCGWDRRAVPAAARDGTTRESLHPPEVTGRRDGAIPREAVSSGRRNGQLAPVGLRFGQRRHLGAAAEDEMVDVPAGKPGDGEMEVSAFRPD